MTNIILTKSKRGGMMILYDYYMYNFDRIVSAEKRWRCQNRRCGSVLYTSIENEFSRCTDHNHLKDINKAKAHVIKMKIKESALTNKTRGEKLIVEKTKD
ncbi:hypothetical protein DMUE_5962, partial [Dictyocoela muelleri]